MIFDIIVLLIAAILLIWSFLRESRRKTIIRLLSLFFILILVFWGSHLPSYTGIITVSRSGSFGTMFGNIDKFSKLNESFSPYFNIIVSDTAYTNSVYHFSDNMGDCDIYIDEEDTGIDTAYIDSGIIHVTVKAMNKHFIPCTLQAEGLEPIQLISDTHIIISKNTVKYITLICNDKNPYNEFFSLDSKPRILIADTVYSRTLQKNIFLLQGMYPEYSFSGALIKDNDIITSAKHYDGIIFTGTMLSDSVPCIHANPENRDDLYRIGQFLDNRALFSKRIVNPFNSGRNIEMSGMDKFILSVKNHLPIIILILLSIIIPVIQ